MPDDTDSSSKKNSTNTVEILQNWFNFSRNVTLSLFAFFIAFVIVFLPKNFNDWRKNAGITVLGGGGVQISFDQAEKVLDSTNTLQESKSTITNLKKQLDTTNQKIEELAKKSQINADEKQLITEQIKTNKQAISAAVSQNQSIKQTLNNAASIINESQSVIAEKSKSWGIILGADNNQEAALDEVKKAKNKGLDVSLYKKDNFYRTVAEFDSKESANQKLSLAKSLNSGAYLVNTDLWCPQKTPAAPFSGISVYECPQ